METKKAYLIKNITEYGKLISYCIDHDISVWRTYWDERESGDRCYFIDWEARICCYSSRYYYETSNYDIVIPTFQLDRYGNYIIIREEEAVGVE